MILNKDNMKLAAQFSKCKYSINSFVSRKFPYDEFSRFHSKLNVYREYKFNSNNLTYVLESLKHALNPIDEYAK